MVIGQAAEGTAPLPGAAHPPLERHRRRQKALWFAGSASCGPRQCLLQHTWCWSRRPGATATAVRQGKAKRDEATQGKAMRRGRIACLAGVPV